MSAACTTPQATTTDETADTFTLTDSTAPADTVADVAADVTDTADATILPTVHPRLLFVPAHKSLILAREHQPPYDAMWTRLRSQAAQTPPAPIAGQWEAKFWSVYAETAQANAVLAWAMDDAAAATKAKTLLLALQDNLEDNDDIDLDIRIQSVLMPLANALDLLQATPWITPAEVAQSEAKLGSVTAKFVARFLDDAFGRMFSLTITQNNHPLRAAAVMGYMAVALPNHPDATRWLDWATDQMDYLLGPKGHYVQNDGGVTEGPFYFSFGFAAVVQFLLTLDRNSPPGALHHHTCITRNSDIDPWTDANCVEGEPFVLVNPLRDPRFLQTFDWSIALRRPTGLRAILNDAHQAILPGGALTTSLGGPSYLTWDWATNAVMPYETSKFDDLTCWYLGHVTDQAPTPPPWRNRFFPDGGQAVFRSGWGVNDIWAMLVADHGAARKTLHNHADGASLALSAYGDDLLIDTGYYKPDAMQNPLTTDAVSHNVILVDGVGAPKRGLLNNWGDTDAFLENTLDGDTLAWAEARVSYEQAQIRRGVAFVRQRYLIVADQIQSDVATPRTFQWRAHLWAGFDVGGTYAVQGNRVTMERDHGALVIAAGTTAGDPTFVEPKFTSLKPPHVHDIDKPGNHAVVDATVSAVAPGFLVVLAPHQHGVTGDDGPLTVTAVPAGPGGTAWLMEGTTAGVPWRDVAWLRAPGASGSLVVDATHTVQTDAAFAWVSLAGDHALLTGGTTVQLDGKALLLNNQAPVAAFAP